MPDEQHALIASGVEIRALSTRDWEAALPLLEASLAESGHAELTLHHAAAARGGANGESAALGAFVEERLVGLALYGAVAGAVGTGRVLYVAVAPAVRRRGLARALIAACTRALSNAGAQTIIAELADAPAQTGASALFAALGFREEGRVADFYRDGVALRVLTRHLP